MNESRSPRGAGVGPEHEEHHPRYETSPRRPPLSATACTTLHLLREHPTSHRFSEKVSFIWSVADLLRGDYKQSEYGRVILPFTVLRRLDQVLSPTRDAVRDAACQFAASPEALRERMLIKASGESFYNTSKLDFGSLLSDPQHLAQNLVGYIHGFSPNARDIVEHFRFGQQIERLDRSNLLYLVVQKFAAIDLHPDRVSNLEMGYRCLTTCTTS